MESGTASKLSIAARDIELDPIDRSGRGHMHGNARIQSTARHTRDGSIVLPNDVHGSVQGATGS